MPVRARCAFCKQIAMYPDETVGGEVACAACGESFKLARSEPPKVGAASKQEELIHVTCGGCDKTYALKSKFANKTIRCPHCKAAVNVPASADKASGKSSRQRKSVATSTTDGGQSSPPTTQSQRTRVQTTQRMQRPSPTPPDTPTHCPACKSPLKPDVVLCATCNYHLKLKRRVNLRKAITSATNRKDGLTSDGSRRIQTRTDIAHERQKKGRKLSGYVFSGVLLLAMLYLGYLGYRIITSVPTPTREEMVEAIRSRGAFTGLSRKPESWSPLWAGESTSTRITPDMLEIVEATSVPSPSLPSHSAHEAATALQLPAYQFTKMRLYSGIAKRLELDALAQKNTPSFLPKDGQREVRVAVIRKAQAPELEGYLEGATIDLGAKLPALESRIKEMQTKFRRQEAMQAQMLEDAFQTWYMENPDGPPDESRSRSEEEHQRRLALARERFLQTPTARKLLTVDPSYHIHLKGTIGYIFSRRIEMDQKNPYAIALIAGQTSLVAGEGNGNGEGSPANEPERATEIFIHPILHVTDFAVTESRASPW